MQPSLTVCITDRFKQCLQSRRLQDILYDVQRRSSCLQRLVSKFLHSEADNVCNDDCTYPQRCNLSLLHQIIVQAEQMKLPNMSAMRSTLHIMSDFIEHPNPSHKKNRKSSWNEIKTSLVVITCRRCTAL